MSSLKFLFCFLSLCTTVSFLGTPVLKLTNVSLLCPSAIHKFIYQVWVCLTRVTRQKSDQGTNQSINQIQYEISKALQKKTMNTDWGMVMFLAQCLVFPLCSLTEPLQQLPQGNEKSGSQKVREITAEAGKQFSHCPYPISSHQLYWTVGGFPSW